MPDTFAGRIKSAWNAFMNRDPPVRGSWFGGSYNNRPDRARLTRGNDRSIVTSVLNRMAMDCAAIEIKHVKLDEDNRYLDTVDSELNRCLSLFANKDQTARAFIHDATLSMFDAGCIALAPIDVDDSPPNGREFDILSLRVAKIVQWAPDHVKLDAYNDRTGQHEEFWMQKSKVAIVENPLYAVMNETNSTGGRLTRKLALLDQVDEMSSSGKLDLIIQLPYALKSAARKADAEQRRQQIADQLSGSKYGIAYTDGTERITQLNRSLDNNLLKQIEYLTELYYSQLGITKEVMNGTADESTMQNYYSRSIEPVLSAITDAIKWKFLTERDRNNRESIMFFRDPFNLVPVSAVPDLADKLTRNEIVSSNEIRQIIGLKPSKDPGADELRNKNLNASKEVQAQLDEQRTEEEKKDD